MGVQAVPDCNLHNLPASQLLPCPLAPRSIGCTRSKVYPSNHSRPSPVNFKIYMYDLNTQLAVSREREAHVVVCTYACLLTVPMPASLP